MAGLINGSQLSNKHTNKQANKTYSKGPDVVGRPQRGQAKGTVERGARSLRERDEELKVTRPFALRARLLGH